MVAVRLALSLERAGEGFLEQVLAVTDGGIHAVEAARRSVIERQSKNDARQLLACEVGPDAAATPQDKDLWCLHTDLIFLHSRLVIAIGLREQRDKTETKYRHALQQWEVRQRSTGVYGPVTDSERRATERAIEKIRLTPPAIPKVEARLLEACGKNGYKRAVALACIAAVDNNNNNATRAAQLFHDSAQVLKACEAAEARLLDQHVGGSACVPRIVTRTDTCIAVMLDAGANTHAKSYAVYAKPTGSGVSVTAKNTSYKGTGGGGVPLGTILTVSGLDPDEGYMLAAGTYSESEGAKPVIGESTPEIVALLPLPLTYLRARVALLARRPNHVDNNSRALASAVAADIVKVPKSTVLDPPQGKVLVETKLREAPAAVLRAVSLLLLSGVSVNESENSDKEGRKCQLACVRECERLALAVEAARALGSDPATQRAATLLLYVHARGLPAPASARFLAAAYAGNADINNDKGAGLGREHATLIYELLCALRACQGGVNNGVTTALITKAVDNSLEAEALKKYILATTTTTTADSPPSTTNTPSTNTTKSPSPDSTSSPNPYTTILPLLSSSPSSSSSSSTTKAYELLVARWRDDDAMLELLVRVCEKARAEGAAVNIVKWGTDGVKRFADRSKVMYSERAAAPTPDVKGGKSSAAGGAKVVSASAVKAVPDTKDTKGGVDVGAAVSEEITHDAAARVLQRGLRTASARRKRVLTARTWARRQQPWVSRLLAIVGVAHYEGGTADVSVALKALAQSANTAMSCGSHAQVQNACRYADNIFVRAHKNGVVVDKSCAMALRNALDALLAMLEALRAGAKSTPTAATDDASDIGSDRDIPAWFEDQCNIHVAWCARFAAAALDMLISTQSYHNAERLAVHFHRVMEGRFADILLPAAILAQREIDNKSEGEWQSELHRSEKNRSKSAQVAATCHASWSAALERYQAFRDTTDNADITLAAWAQVMGKGIVSACEREYERAAAFVRAHKEGGAEGGAFLLAALSDEQGDVRLLLRHAEADASWHDCLDACAGQYRAVLNWEEVRASAATVGGLLVKLGTRRCALAGIAAAKIALYGGEQAAWPIATELLSAAFFDKSVEFPLKPRDYDLSLPTPARGLFFEPSAWPPPLSATTLYAGLTHCIHSTLSSFSLSSTLSALPLCAALGHLARHVLKDIQRDARAKALRVRALCACGRVTEAARCIVGLMQGRDVASAVSEEGTMWVASAGKATSTSPPLTCNTYDARMPPGHEVNQPCVGLISAGEVDAELMTRYGADAMAELTLARAAFLMCVGQRADPAGNRSETAPATAPKTPATQSKSAANAAAITPFSSTPWPLLDAAAQLLNRVHDDYGLKVTGKASDSALTVYRETTAQLAVLLQAQLKFSQALELNEKLLRLPSLSGQSADRNQLQYAELCVEDGQTNRAREVCESVLNANNAHSNALVGCAAHAMLAEICFNAGDYPAAAKQYDTVIGADGDCCPSLFIACGEAHEHAGNTLTALKRYCAGVERARADLDTHGFSEMRAHAELSSGYIHTVPIAVKALLCASRLDAERELELCSEANELIGYIVNCPLWLHCLVKLTLGKAQMKSGQVGEAEESLTSSMQAAVSDGGHDCEALRTAYIALAAISAQRNHNRALVCLQTAARLAAMRAALDQGSSNLTVVNLTGVPSFIAQAASAAGSNAGQVLFTQLSHLHRVKGRSVNHDSIRTRISLLHCFLKTASPTYLKQCCMELAAELPGDDAAGSIAPGTIITQWEDGDISTCFAQGRLIYVIGSTMPTSGQRTYALSTLKHLSAVAAKVCASIDSQSFTPEALNEARLYAAQCLSKGHQSSSECDSWRTSATSAQEKESWTAGDAMLSTAHWRLLEALVDNQRGLDCTDAGLAQWLSSVLTS